GGQGLHHAQTRRGRDRRRGDRILPRQPGEIQSSHARRIHAVIAEERRGQGVAPRVARDGVSETKVDVPSPIEFMPSSPKSAAGKARSKGDYRMPSPLYDPKFGSPLLVDQPLYGRLGNEVERRSLVDSFIVPIRSGKAWPALAGQVCRIVAVEGPQVVDFN